MIVEGNFFTNQNKHPRLKYFYISNLVDKKFIVVTNVPIN
jgi:hypothetical protein